MLGVWDDRLRRLVPGGETGRARCGGQRAPGKVSCIERVTLEDDGGRELREGREPS